MHAEPADAQVLKARFQGQEAVLKLLVTPVAELGPQRVERELTTLSNLQHSSIVQVGKGHAQQSTAPQHCAGGQRPEPPVVVRRWGPLGFCSCPLIPRGGLWKLQAAAAELCVLEPGGAHSAIPLQLFCKPGRVGFRV